MPPVAHFHAARLVGSAPRQRFTPPLTMEAVAAAGAVVCGPGTARVLCLSVLLLHLLIGRNAALCAASLATAVAAATAPPAEFRAPATWAAVAAALALLAVDIFSRRGLKASDMNGPATQHILAAVKGTPAFVPPLPEQRPRAGTPATSRGSEASDAPASPAMAGPAAAAGAGGGATDLRAAGVPLPLSLPLAPEGSDAAHAFTPLTRIANKVRGRHYLQDRVKVPAAAPVFTCVNVDAFLAGAKVEDVGAHPQAYLAKARAAGDDRFYFIVNYITPPAPYVMMVLYFAAPREALTAEPAFASLWRSFLSEDDAWRNERLKIIPNVPEAPWAVRWAVGGARPVLLGRRLAHEYVLKPEQGYVEVDCDVQSSAWASGIVGTLRGNITHVVIDLAFTLEGRSEAELPERLIGAVQLRYMDLKRIANEPV